VKIAARGVQQQLSTEQDREHTRPSTGISARRSLSPLLDCLKPVSRAQANAVASVNSSRPGGPAAQLKASGIRLPGVSASQRLEAAVLKASIASAGGGTVRPEAMVSEGNALESVDIGGDAIFARQAELVRSAKEEVCIQTFAWDPNSAGAKMILDALLDVAQARRQQAGSSSVGSEPLRVRLLVNEGTGFAQTFMRMTSANKSKGAPKRWPSSPEALVGNYKKSPDHKYASLTRDIDFQVRVHQHRSSDSIHAKSVIVDGQKAAMTGANVQSRNHGANPAYDFGISMSGGVAQGLREDFASSWNNCVNPDQETLPLPDRVDVSASPAASAGARDIKMAILTHRPNWNVLNDRNDNPQNQAFLAAINTAHESIQVMTPNLNAPAVIHALANAANRGVRVQILASKGFNDERVNNRIAGGTNDAALSRLRRLVKNGDMLDVRYFRNPQGDPAAPVPNGNVAGNGASHAKFMAVDGAMAIVGSANMDKTSWHFSGETNTAIFDPNASRRIKTSVFDPAWERSELAN
jgi:phosphatidylserine/phosphatidylglycerophosphate/cardiolipin synthase-like enzyme